MSKYTNIILSNHEQYLEVLRALEEKTEYVEMDFIDPSVSRIRYELLQNSDGELDFSEYSGVNDEDRNNEVINFAFENLEFIKKEYSDRWSGAFRYVFKADRVFFEFLRKFESFYINEITNNSFETRNTDFGCDDICFYDEDNNKLFYTTTHEGYGTASTKLDLDMDIIKEFGDCDTEDMHLTSNEQYLEVLRALEDRAEYIEIRHNNEEVSESFSDYLRYLEENKDEPECMKTLKEVKENLNLGVASFALENLQRVWT